MTPATPRPWRVQPPGGHAMSQRTQGLRQVKDCWVCGEPTTALGRCIRAWEPKAKAALRRAEGRPHA